MYVMKLAYQIYETLDTLICDRNKRDFSEMFLHHIVTLMLVLFSYSTNFLPIGAVIMLIHDASDILLGVFRLIIESSPRLTNTGLLAYIVCVSGWIYFRIYFLAYWCIRLLYEDCSDHSHPV